MAQTDHELALQSDNLFSDARIELIRNTVAKGAPDDMFLALIDFARRRNLDPLAKQVSLIPFKGVYQIITTIDGYRSLAAQSGQFAGKDAPVFTWPEGPDYLEDGKPNPAIFTKSGKRKPESCTVTVHKLVNGQTYPFAATIFFDEYDTGTNRWDLGPKGQAAKVAEAHALRMAFPSLVSGSYTDDEMDQATVETTAYVVTERPRAVPQPPGPAQRTVAVSQGGGAVRVPQAEPVDMPQGVDGKATYHLKKLGALAGSIQWSRTDLDDLSLYRFGYPVNELVGDDVELLHKELQEVFREGPDAVADLRRRMLGREEIDPDTGEVVPPAGGAGEVIDLPDTAIRR